MKDVRDLYVIRKLCSECYGVAERKGAKFICRKCGKIEKPQECEGCQGEARALAIQNYALMQDKHGVEKELVLLVRLANRAKLERDQGLQLLREVSLTTAVSSDLADKIRRYVESLDEGV